MPFYAESPFERIVNVHWKKKKPNGGNGGTGPPVCVPEYVSPFAAWFLYADGSATTLLPHTCCPSNYFIGEGDYGQHTVWSGGATTLTLTVNLPDGYMASHPGLTIGAWIRPQQNPLHLLNPLIWVSLEEPGVIVLFGPAGRPTQTSGSDSTLTITIPLKPPLTPADVPGSPPADPDRVLIGTTMVQFALWNEALFDLGIFRNANQLFPDGSTLTVQHDCPPDSTPLPPPTMIGLQPYKRRR